MEKDIKYTIRFTKAHSEMLARYCVEHQISVAEFIRHAVLQVLHEDIKNASKTKPWSPVDEYDLQNEVGQGFDQTKSRYNPELITSYAEKVRARQTKTV